MNMSRRSFVGVAMAAGASQLVPQAYAATAAPIRAVAFDGFVIFDPRPVVGFADRLVPGRGAELVEAWRTRQFEYTWLRTLSGRYVDFWRVTEDALRFAAASRRIALTPEQEQALMQAHLQLPAWPDVRAGLEFQRGHARSQSQVCRARRILRGAPFDRSCRGIQTRCARLPDGSCQFRPAQRADRIRCFWRVGRGRREGIRLSHLLGEPRERARRRAGNFGGRRGNDAGGPGQVRIQAIGRTMTASMSYDHGSDTSMLHIDVSSVPRGQGRPPVRDSRT